MTADSSTAQDAQALALAREIIDDLEFSRVPLDSTIQKAARLGRVVDDPELREFALCESIGYPEDRKQRFHSMTNRDKLSPPYFGSCAMLLHIMQTIDDRRKLLATIASSRQGSLQELTTTLQAAHAASEELVVLYGVQHKIAALLHTMVAKHLHRLSFADRQASMFQDAQQEIDALLRTLNEEAVGKLDSAHERLRTGGSEAISHAMTSCRRLMEQVADVLFPATNETRNVGGTEVKLGQQQVLNRLKAYIDDHTDSDSRRTRLKQTFTNLWGRTSAGVHADVTAVEAEYIYLTVYVALGELLSLRYSEAT